jgi:hypothetical protein
MKPRQMAVVRYSGGLFSPRIKTALEISVNVA